MRHRFHITDKLDDTTRDQLQRLQRAARIRDNRDKDDDKRSAKRQRTFVNTRERFVAITMTDLY